MSPFAPLRSSSSLLLPLLLLPLPPLHPSHHHPHLRLVELSLTSSLSCNEYKWMRDREFAKISEWEWKNENVKNNDNKTVKNVTKIITKKMFIFQSRGSANVRQKNAINERCCGEFFYVSCSKFSKAKSFLFGFCCEFVFCERITWFLLHNGKNCRFYVFHSWQYVLRLLS